MDTLTEIEDPIFRYAILGFLITLIGWLVYNHTGTEQGQIEAVYWAGVATPLLSQVGKKLFSLGKKD